MRVIPMVCHSNGEGFLYLIKKERQKQGERSHRWFTTWYVDRPLGH